MPELLDPQWEYWTGDPEVEQFLVEQAAERVSDRGKRIGDSRMPGAFHDNRGYGFVRRPAHKAGAVRRGAGEVIDSLWNHLNQHGPNTVAGLALSEGINRWTVYSALCRKAGALFKVVGRAPMRRGVGAPPLVWSAVTDEESAAFHAGVRPREEFLSDRRLMFIQFGGTIPKFPRRREPFTWVAA